MDQNWKEKCPPFFRSKEVMVGGQKAYICKIVWTEKEKKLLKKKLGAKALKDSGIPGF